MGYSNPISPLLTPAHVETLRSQVSQRIRDADPTCPTPRAPVPPGRGSEERARRGRREGTQEIQGKRAGESGRPESPPEDLPPFYPPNGSMRTRDKIREMGRRQKEDRQLAAVAHPCSWLRRTRLGRWGPSRFWPPQSIRLTCVSYKPVQCFHPAN